MLVRVHNTITGHEYNIAAVTNDTASAVWPPPEAQDKPTLPTSLRLTLSQPGQEPLQTEVLIQTATGIHCPIERANAENNAATNSPAGE